MHVSPSHLPGVALIIDCHDSRSKGILTGAGASLPVARASIVEAAAVLEAATVSESAAVRKALILFSFCFLATNTSVAD